MLGRRSFAASLAGATSLAALPTRAQEVSFFRILTGGTVGTYFPIGGLIANAISNPPGSRLCDEGGSCGVPGLIATAVASNGSVANAAAIASGAAQSGFVQSDIAYWAHSGTGIYEGRPKLDGLRAIANLFPESLHLVVRKGSGITSVRDLKGKRVSLDEPGSGTLVDARLVLGAFGISERDLKPSYLPAQHVADSLKDGTIDAFFSVSGWPQSSIVDLATTVGIDLVPIEGPEIDRLLKQYSFLTTDEIPDEAYKGVGGVKTVSVHALWLTSVRQPEPLIYLVTAALWNSNTRKLLDSGHVKGRVIRLASALMGVGIPLHPGAERFYKERGLTK
ncbi:MAG: TAXI family TRAP transporter solute-binding subunit [Proteobacteria bacterium]|nr:TAXI family TRAP transporter solute-binding subunit [Pseudomonadota bacterium]